MLSAIFFFVFGNSHQLVEQFLGQALNHTSNFCLTGGKPSGYSYICALASFQFNLASVEMCVSLTLRSGDTKFIGCSTENREKAGEKVAKLQLLSGLTQNPSADGICTHSPDPKYFICVYFEVHDDETNACGYTVVTMKEIV